MWQVLLVEGTLLQIQVTSTMNTNWKRTSCLTSASTNRHLVDGDEKEDEIDFGGVGFVPSTKFDYFEEDDE